MTILKNCLLENFHIINCEETLNTELLTLSFKNNKKKAQVSFEIPLIDIAYFWHPTKGNKLNLINEWEQEIITQLNYSMPIFTLLDNDGQNKYTIYHNQDLKKVRLKTGVIEETSQISFCFEFSASRGFDIISVRIDKREQSFSESVNSARNWIFQTNDYRSLKSNDF